jgi:hypothetical protein
MQHYLKYGYGFLSSSIKEFEFDNAQNIVENDRNLQMIDSKVGFVFVSHTEDYPQHDWSTAVLRSLGELPHYGKAVTLSEFSKINAEYGSISANLKSEFLDALRKVGLEHMIDKVELIIYSDNY